MDMYRNTVTGEVFTVDESREAYEEFEWDFRLEYDSFEDWFAEMIKKGDFEKVAQGQTSNKKREKRRKAQLCSSLPEGRRKDTGRGSERSRK